jgi:hypothetical protein
MQSNLARRYQGTYCLQVLFQEKKAGHSSKMLVPTDKARCSMGTGIKQPERETAQSCHMLSWHFQGQLCLYFLPTYQTAQCHNPEHHNTNTERCKNVIYYTMNQNHVSLTFLPIIKNEAGICKFVCQIFWWKITHICICGSNRHSQLLINFTLHA